MIAVNELAFGRTVLMIKDGNLIIRAFFAALSEHALMDANAHFMLRAPRRSLRTASIRSIVKVDKYFVVKAQWRHTNTIDVRILERFWTEAGHFAGLWVFRVNELVWTRLFANLIHVWFGTIVTDASIELRTVVCVFMTADLTIIRVERYEINLTI